MAKNSLLKICFIILFSSTIIVSHGQENSDAAKAFKFLYAMDPNRKNVSDSLKYLIPILDSIWESDQQYRWGMFSNPFGKAAQEKAYANFMSHKKEQRFIDSINVLKVTAIIDRYGWLGYKTIGTQESHALFFVIQHADFATQEKYLPLIRKAVQEKKESPFNLIMLEDRVSLHKNKYQIYGTQVLTTANKNYVFPLIDVENLFERRKSIGLDSASFQSYLNQFKIKWDIETYKQELPTVEQLMKKLK